MDFIEDCQVPTAGAKEGGCDSATLPWLIIAAVAVAVLLLVWYSGKALWASESMVNLPPPRVETQPAPGSIVKPNDLQAILY